MVPLNSRDLRTFRSAILDWYDAHRRDLPWRRDADPYRVWVSEVMLQQTRVAAVLEHYARWIERFPTVQALAAAREQSVLAMWSGLGYYHRARRLHGAAKLIVREHKGEFPRNVDGWRELPGIGRYTAAAIASIAFGEPVAVLDGNVERVLDRLFGPAGNTEGNWLRAEALLDRERSGDFNQAMMELGATVCTPKSPRCLLCPLITWCATRGSAVSKPQPPRQRKRLQYALVQQDNSIMLVQRPADAKRMAGMWELPEVSAPMTKEPLATFRHSITNTDYSIAVVPGSESLIRQLNGKGRWFTSKQWQKLALTGLARKILNKLAPATS